MAGQVEVEKEMLMNCIQNYPLIYDKKCADYKIPLRKKNGGKLGIQESEAKARYSSIRTNFSKYIKKHRLATRSVAGRNDISEFALLFVVFVSDMRNNTTPSLGGLPKVVIC